MTASYWPAASVKSSREAFDSAFRAGAQSHGAVIIENFSFEAPWTDIKSLQDLLVRRPDICERLNAAQPPTKPNVKLAAVNFNKDSNRIIDQKVSLDSSAKRISKMAEDGVDIVELLGEQCKSIIDFHANIEALLAPRIMQALSGLVDDQLDSIHSDRAFTLRLCHYFERQAGEIAPRCGKHRDYGTFTIIFQDASQPGLEMLRDGVWQRVPAGCCVVQFGWCSQIRSNDRIKALPHRVVDSPAGADGIVPRRDSVAFFVAPDEAALLETITREGEVALYADMPTTHKQFKALMARRWSEREGTVEAGSDTRSQEDIVEEYQRAATMRHASAMDSGPAIKEALSTAAAPAICA
ncbi:hypothetical protein WJX73_008603 [Symbiochloris irregularis]|uniref:Fe2OG dioxygenase domain-containing protein n=1 Tax=Symbiochloris irregularis TaxID=706552 RepID=A0AAW1NJS2_9CHLO